MRHTPTGLSLRFKDPNHKMIHFLSLFFLPLNVSKWVLLVWTMSTFTIHSVNIWSKDHEEPSWADFFTNIRLGDRHRGLWRSIMDWPGCVFVVLYRFITIHLLSSFISTGYQKEKEKTYWKIQPQSITEPAICSTNVSNRNLYMMIFFLEIPKPNLLLWSVFRN